MDQILLPLAHVPLSCDTTITQPARVRLGTSLVMSLVMHSMTGQAYATLPLGYEFQNAYLGGGNQAQSPCQQRRTTTESYTYQIPSQNEIYFHPRYGRDSSQIQIDNRRFVLFDLF